MKIGITCYPTYGGSGVVATELGIELAKRGHEIHFITYSQPIRLTNDHPNIHFHEVTVSTYPLFQYPPYDLALATRMAEVADVYALDLLHVHYAIPHSISAFLAREMLAKARNGSRRRLPFVTTLHGTDITLVGQDRSYLPVTRFSIDESDGVTAISHYLEQRTVAEFDVKRPIDVIHNFVNCEIYRRPDDWRELRREYAAADESLLIHLSNFRPVKRIQEVIEIFDRIAKQRPARLLMIGDGPERARAEWSANSKGIRDRVCFMGKQDEVYKLLGLADLMLLPSELESFGLASLEAMACETPSIATTAGGVPELVEHGVTGMLTAVGDTELMTRYALELLADEPRLRQMGKLARAAAKERFSAARIVEQYERCYARVVAGA